MIIMDMKEFNYIRHNITFSNKTNRDKFIIQLKQFANMWSLDNLLKDIEKAPIEEANFRNDVDFIFNTIEKIVFAGENLQNLIKEFKIE